MTLRVDHRTVTRDRRFEFPPQALVKVAGDCGRCGDNVEEDEPVELVGQVTVQQPDGTRTVDLSGAEWCHQGRCPAEAVS